VTNGHPDFNCTRHPRKVGLETLLISWRSKVRPQMDTRLCPYSTHRGPRGAEAGAEHDADDEPPCVEDAAQQARLARLALLGGTERRCTEPCSPFQRA
jgi:hypothetical protein